MAGMKRLLLILAMALVALPAHAAPKAELWDRWVGSNETSTRSVDHSPWDRILAAYVVAGDDGINRVRYGDVAPVVLDLFSHRMKLHRSGDPEHSC